MGVTPRPGEETDQGIESLRNSMLLAAASQRLDRVRLRASAAYLVGHLVVDLRTGRGWRALPGRIMSLVGRVRRRGTPEGRLRLPSREAPRQPGLAIVAAGDTLVGDLGGALGVVAADPAWFDHQFLDADLVVAEHGPDRRGRTSPRALRRLFDGAERRGVRRVLWDAVGAGPVPDALARRADVVVVDSATRAAEPSIAATGGSIVVVPGVVDPRRPFARDTADPVVADFCFAPRWTPGRRPAHLPALDDLLLGARTVGSLRVLDDSPRLRRRLHHPAPLRVEAERSVDHSLPIGRAGRVLLHAHPAPDRIDASLFRALAERTPVVSVPHRGVEECFDGDVPMPSGRAAIDEVLGAFLDPQVRHRTAHLGWRRVMTDHTADRVAGRILRAAGLPAVDDTVPTVDVIIATNRPAQVDFALDNVRRQLHPRVRLIFVAHGDGFDIPDLRGRLTGFPGSRLVEMPAERALGECLNAGIEAGDGEWFAKFDDDDWYGPRYLSDMLLARRVTDSAVLGKRTVFMHFQSDDTTVLRNPDKEFARIGLVMGPTLLVDRSRLGSIRFPALNVGEDTGFLAACSEAGLRPFSTDRFNFVQVRRANPASHTWAVDEAEMRRDAIPVGSGLCLDLAWV